MRIEIKYKFLFHLSHRFPSKIDGIEIPSLLEDLMDNEPAKMVFLFFFFFLINSKIIYKNKFKFKNNTGKTQITQ